MEVVALNQRLRGSFSTLLKLLPPPFAVSAFAQSATSVSTKHRASSDFKMDGYTQHCRLMLWRLNSYQYGSLSAYLEDLEQLERVCESPDTRKQVKQLLDETRVSESEQQAPQSTLNATKSSEASVPLDSTSGIPGIQEIVFTHANETTTISKSAWLCNVSVEGQVVTLGTYSSQQEALDGYENERQTIAVDPTSFTKYRQLAAQMALKQREEHARVLKEALAQCHPRLTTMKVSTTSASQGNSMTSRSLAKPLVATPLVGASITTKEVLSGSSRGIKKQKLEPTRNTEALKPKTEPSTSLTEIPTTVVPRTRSYLKLRRLIQQRLCRHLKGQDVCVLSSFDQVNHAKWRASGRLEAGKVYSFHKKRQMTFAAYVQDELGRAVSACAHMFLIATRESIDAHLKVCDAFSDKDRESGPRLLNKTRQKRR
ncbi:uncharacterized protein CCR75_009441 [Bremia lactucae]|uniref:Uncharacterized protein n=1 Tax=Bremia lactucae TaxID=4779 RepID=A0A976IM92_BRELC|nr:hypothetical protein CCR75_009441 [Bremia lactucae]